MGGSGSRGPRSRPGEGESGGPAFGSGRLGTCEGSGMARPAATGRAVRGVRSYEGGACVLEENGELVATGCPAGALPHCLVWWWVVTNCGDHSCPRRPCEGIRRQEACRS